MEKKTWAAAVIATIVVTAVGAGIGYQNYFTGGNSVGDESNATEVIATNLDIPWEIKFLPNGDMLVTERSGDLLRIERDNGQTKKIEIEGVAHRGEGGLLGLALHPDYEENNWIYLYMTTRTKEGLRNRVVRYQLTQDQLSNRKVIIDDLPGAAYHDGGRIDFGPDGKLWITAGDATNGEWAQTKDILAGKIFRLNPDGSIPEDNPFGSEVYSYGHRNPQGITWVNGELWITEHGRSGIKTGMDELNFIENGKNYGWPRIEGDETREGMETPVIHSGPDITWAPAGAAHLKGSIYFAGLKGSGIYQAEIEGRNVVNFRKHLDGEFGRIRAVTIGPEDDIYISTSNTDGRGKPVDTDDRIIRVDLENLEGEKAPYQEP